MKKVIILAATVALFAGACGKKDKVEEAANKADNVAEKVVEKATDAKNAVVEGSKDTAEAYGSGDKKESYGSDSDHMGNLTEASYKALNQACLDEGKSAEICACSTKAVSGLKTTTIDKLVQSVKAQAEGGAEAGDNYLRENLTQAEGLEIFGVTPKLMECDPSLAEAMQ